MAKRKKNAPVSKADALSERLDKRTERLPKVDAIINPKKSKKAGRPKESDKAERQNYCIRVNQRFIDLIRLDAFKGRISAADVLDSILKEHYK